MTTFTHNNREILCVEVPPEATNFSLDGFRNHVSADLILNNDKQMDWFSEKLPEENYTILGLTTEITEEVARELVDVVKDNTGNSYMHYQQNRYLFNLFAKQSLTSRILSLGFNPERTLIIERKK